MHQEYSVLDYEEKVVDGFYDVYGPSTNSALQGKIPCLADLETNLGNYGFEVVIVNRTIDPVLEEPFGGPVKDATIKLARWMERSTELRTSLHTSLLPIGSINIGLPRHRALLFKIDAGVSNEVLGNGKKSTHLLVFRVLHTRVGRSSKRGTMERRQLTAESVPLFQEGIGLLLYRWSVLQLAVENEWGGRDSRRKAELVLSDVFSLEEMQYHQHQPVKHKHGGLFLP
ncbi:hypothetical protein SLEP1_g36641 [Rubroshorea leprosula]|uniref:EDR1/CTR1/ARMC3-like peptidase-like domain-containing protein n=1 Tax=Rubroshorea leprosula TaxID=152421 RepID=A0AAV5KSC3_9ROSI|nr:hypothetical protein SLEP1_g36641 [Rubroshorea leprosula]